MTIKDYERIVLEHYNETKPDLLRLMVKENPLDLKYEMQRRANIAMGLKKHYQENTDLNSTEINEMANNYLAPAEELPEETVKELSEKEIDRIIKLLEKL